MREAVTRWIGACHHMCRLGDDAFAEALAGAASRSAPRVHYALAARHVHHACCCCLASLLPPLLCRAARPRPHGRAPFHQAE